MFFDWYAEEIELDGHIESGIDIYRQGREEYWREAAEGRFLAVIDQAGDVALQATQSLLAPGAMWDKPVDLETSRILAAGGLPRQLVREKIQIEIGWTHATTTKAMAERCLELFELLLEAQPGDAVQRYMQRLSRCYILGLLPEAVILCRSVLESAVRELFDRKGVTVESGKDRLEMRARLDFALMSKWLTPDGRRMAWEVWQRGNTAIHNDPEAVKDVLGTIRATMHVLAELYRA